MKFEELGDVLTVMQVAEFLKIGKTKTYDMVKEGVLGHFKIGSTIRIPKRSLVDYVYRNMEGGEINGNKNKKNQDRDAV